MTAITHYYPGKSVAMFILNASKQPSCDAASLSSTLAFSTAVRKASNGVHHLSQEILIVLEVTLYAMERMVALIGFIQESLRHFDIVLIKMVWT